jgi:hypothetical protein
MAKKTNTGARTEMSTVVEEPSFKLVRLVLPQNVHGIFRVEAAKEGMSMAGMARRLVEGWVAERTRANSR